MAYDNDNNHVLLLLPGILLDLEQEMMFRMPICSDITSCLCI
jgi:hypothetical protein